jgi:hypothetical protein
VTTTLPLQDVQFYESLAALFISAFYGEERHVMLASVKSYPLPLGADKQILYFAAGGGVKRVGLLLPSFQAKPLSGNYLVDLLSFLKKLNFLGSQLNLQFTLEKRVVQDIPLFPFVCDSGRGEGFYFGIEGDCSYLKFPKMNMTCMPLAAVELWGKLKPSGMTRDFLLKGGGNSFSCRLLTNSFFETGGIDMKNIENFACGEAEINIFIGRLRMPLFEVFNLRKDAEVSLDLPADLDVELRIGESVWRSAKLNWKGGEVVLKIL